VLERIKNSSHDIVFLSGCLSIGLFFAWCFGYVGCVFSWTGSEKINAVNFAYTGDIDAKGKFTKR
jgi:hypothetical protein